MAKLKKRKLSQPPSQNENLHHQSIVPTPEIEVSLVDRMKRRFSTRNPSASEPSVSDGEPSTASSQDSTVKETGSRRKISKSNLAKKVTQIDKYFSPDVGGSRRLFQSPTRFPIRSSLMSTGAEETLDGEQMSDSQNSTGPIETDGHNSDNTEDEKGLASSNEINTDKDSDNRNNESQTSTRAKKRKSDPGPSRSLSDEGDETGEQLEGRRRSQDRLEQSQQGPETVKVSKKRTSKKKDTLTIASGEVEAHMADKEFISSQVRAMSTPFVLESGPRSWMNAWRAQQSFHYDLPDIPSSLIDRIVTKINFTMEDVYQRQLGRQRQRTTLMRLDELRKEPQEDSQSSLKPSLRDQANLQEVISSYPSEWPGSVGEEDQELAERYSSLRARLFALSRSETLSNQQCDQYKSLLGVLKMIHTNLDKHCLSQDLREEVKRSKDLIFKITQKLQSGALDEGPNASLKDGRSDSKQPSVSFTNHNDLIKTLFKVTVSSEPP
ncbi:uncharacterized protein [Asterias amurensis]|uniref:uncharacterized protein n=1 Tax=Asterias amurensis TaxID=7602 RepID=UPI003AB416CA